MNDHMHRITHILAGAGFAVAAAATTTLAGAATPTFAPDSTMARTVSGKANMMRVPASTGRQLPASNASESPVRTRSASRNAS